MNVNSIRVIPAEFVHEAEFIVDRANRKAANAGLEQSFECAWSESTIETYEGGWLVKTEDVATFVVFGDTIRIEGWEFVATIVWDSETGLAITRVVPGLEVDLSKHRDTQLCEHCNTNRARKSTFVLREVATGETKQVGGNCLANFIGISPDAALSYLGETFEAFESFERTEIRYPLEYVVGLASAAIAEFGWVAASSFQGQPTRDVVSAILHPRTSGPGAKADKELADRVLGRLEAEGSVAQERAAAVVEWVRAGDVGGSEYAQNLQAAFAGETISQKSLGLVVSSVSAWARYTDRQIEKAQQAAERANSEWVGNLKERLRGLQLTVINNPRFFQGDYGTTTLLVFSDGTGNVFKWWASGTWDVAIGAKFAGAGTVKEHEEYNGAKSTVLTRCKLEGVTA